MPVLNLQGKLITTVDDANDFIARNPAASSATLIELAGQMETKVSGKVTSVLLYSGGMDSIVIDGQDRQTGSGELAKVISEQSLNANALNPNLGKTASMAITDAGKFIGSENFKTSLSDALARNLGLDPTKLSDQPAIEAALNKSLYGVTENGIRTQDGIWDKKSIELIQKNVTAETPVKTLTVTAEPERVFSQKEVDAIRNSPAPSVDGTRKADYDGIYNRSYTEGRASGLSDADAKRVATVNVRDAIKVSSFENSSEVTYLRDKTTGVINAVDVGPKFYDGVSNPPPVSQIPDGTPDKTSYLSSLNKKVNNHYDSLQNGAHQIAKQNGLPGYEPDPAKQVTVDVDGSAVTKAGSKLLNTLGIVGDTVAMMLAIGAANKAYAAGDTDGAARIVGSEIVGLVGGVAGSAAAIAIAAPILATLGVGAGIGVIAAAVIGGAIGDPVARAAWEKALSAMAEMGLVPKGGIQGLLDDYGWAFDNPGALLDGLKGLLPDWLQPAGGKFGNAPNASSPLVLDLDGDGVETLAMGYGAGASTTYFDTDNDGFAERTGWATGGDGLLALDKNANGKIDNQSELFGNSAAHADGFAALAALDSNKDGKITSADSQWSKLRVWVDGDKDGITDSGELKTLSTLKITEISLAATQHSNLYNNENPVTASSTFVMNGQTRTVSDVWFRGDQMDTRFTGNYTLDPKTLFLPTLKGFGQLKDLHVAMSGDAALLTMVENFAKNWSMAKFANTAALDTEIKSILFKWAGVDNVAAGSRGTYVDAHAISFMEKLTGQYWGGGATPRDPAAPNQGLQTNESFSIAFSAMKAQLIIQAGAGHLFTKPPVYDFINGVLTDGVLSASGIAALAAQAPASSASTSVKQAYWNYIADFLLSTKDYADFTAAEKASLNSAVGANISGKTFDDVVASLPTFAANLAGTEFSDYVVGTRGAETLSGLGGNDILSGGRGDDYLHGGNGNDLYIYHVGDGTDRIQDYLGTDSLRIDGNYLLSDIKIKRTEDLLEVHLKDIKIIDVQYHFQYWTTDYLFESISLNNGTVIDTSQIRNVMGDISNNTLNGLDNIHLRDDYIYGESGNDTLNGKIGNDFLFGGSGNDKYVYSNGTDQGTDRVRDDEGTLDSIVLGSAYTSSNVTLERIDIRDLAIKSAGKTLMVIENQFSSYGSIETLTYGNGTSLNLLTYSHTVNGTSLADTIYGTSYGAGGDRLNGLAGNDSIYAGAGNDVVTGGDGNDYLYGEDGNDTLSGNAGNDTVNGGLGNDTIIYESGLDRFSDTGGTDVISITNTAITSANLTLRRNVGNQNDLDVLLSGTHAFTINGQFAQNGGFETIRFSNGTTFNLTNIQYTSTGTSGNDTLYGISYGGNPNDIMNGGAGNDNLYGYDGNDTLDGGVGTDRFYGGKGNDIYKISLNSGVDVISDEAGSDTIQFGAGFNRTNMTVQRDAVSANNLNILFGGVLAVTIQNHFQQGYLVETLRFSDNTTYSLTGVSFTQNGTAASDYLQGYDGVDVLKGNGGNDSIYAYAGNDTLEGGAGRDYLYGGLGDDTYVFGAIDGLDYISDYGGIDAIRLGIGVTTENISIADYSSYDTKIIVNADVNEMQIYNQRYAGNAYAVEKLQFSDGFVADLLTYRSWVWGSTAAQTTNGTANADTIFGRGGNDTINGNAGNDALHGGSGNDIVKGGDGNDIVHGGIGNDSIYGDAGNDVLYGDDGLDNLWGGAGADTFMFLKETAFKNIDVINDFSRTQLDKINVKDLLQGFDPLTKAITDYVQITTSGSDSILRVDADGGANGFVQIATLKGVTGLTDEAALLTVGTLIA